MIRWHDVLHQTEPDAVVLSDHKINTFLFYKSHRCRFCHLNRTTISLPFDRRFPSGPYTIRHRGCCRRAERQELSESPRSFAPARKSNNFLNGCGRRRSGSHAGAQDPKASTLFTIKIHGDRLNYIVGEKVDDHPQGYPRLAAAENSDASLIMYQRFGYIQNRILLR
jgi:hypothetical protein